MFHFLQQIAGASPCAGGIVSACPYYVSPLWYAAAILSGVFGLTLIVRAIRNKKTKYKKKKKFITHLLIGAVCLTISFFCILEINHIKSEGSLQWGKHMREYNKCLENEKKAKYGYSVACEF